MIRLRIFVAILLAMLLCFLGFYLSWMLGSSESDDGDIGVNVITGSVSIDIVDEENKTLIGDVLDFVSGGVETKILFAPGSAFRTEGFKVKNTGTLDVEYIISISEDNSVDKEAFLSAFEFWITTDPDNYTDGQGILSFDGELRTNSASDVYYLVVRISISICKPTIYTEI